MDTYSIVGLTVSVCLMIIFLILLEVWLDKNYPHAGGSATIAFILGLIASACICIPGGMSIDRAKPIAGFYEGCEYKFVSISRVSDEPNKVLIGARMEDNKSLYIYSATYESVRKFNHRKLPFWVEVRPIGQTIEFRSIKPPKESSKKKV